MQEITDAQTNQDENTGSLKRDVTKVFFFSGEGSFRERKNQSNLSLNFCLFYFSSLTLVSVATDVVVVVIGLAVIGVVGVASVVDVVGVISVVSVVSAVTMVVVVAVATIVAVGIVVGVGVIVGAVVVIAVSIIELCIILQLHSLGYYCILYPSCECADAEAIFKCLGLFKKFRRSKN